MASAAEVVAMRRALALAERGAGATSPNPIVGAVVLHRDGEVAGEGFHTYAGRDHAEVIALRAAGERARGGTLVVTLSPCTRTGRTPPCTDAIRAAGIARVVYAVGDPGDPPAPSPDAESGVLADEAARANEAWLLAIRLRRPFVTLKYAATLDGFVAPLDGPSRWITSPEARADAHRLRAEVDAVAAGVGTVLADDPHLTVRTADGALAGRQPLRVVLDRSRRTPAIARVRDNSAETLVSDADLDTLLKGLYDRDVRHVLVEGGPTIAGAFLDAGLVDRIVAYIAPRCIGAGLPIVRGAGRPLAESVDFRLDDTTQIGPDVRLTLRPVS